MLQQRRYEPGGQLYRGCRATSHANASHCAVLLHHDGAAGYCECGTESKVCFGRLGAIPRLFHLLSTSADEQIMVASAYCLLNLSTARTNQVRCHSGLGWGVVPDRVLSLMLLS